MAYNPASIQQALEGFPSANLSLTPTPIYQLTRLSSYLGHTIHIMREDMTGFAIGGNKVRKLDYLIGDARARGADTLITSKASSFSRNAAVAASVSGIDVHVIVAGAENTQNPASQALFRQVGARLHYAVAEPGAPLEEAMALEYQRVLARLCGQGKAVYELHPGGSDRIGTLGYVNAFSQIVHHSLNTGTHFNRIFHSTGSSATQAGLLLGHVLSSYETKITGIAASRTTAQQCEDIHRLVLETASMLGIDLDDTSADLVIDVDDSFIGPGYAVPSDEGIEASALFARLEGVLLDDVYSAKAAAGLIAYARNGKLFEGENALFIHTGGNAGLFY